MKLHRKSLLGNLLRCESLFRQRAVKHFEIRGPTSRYASCHVHCDVTQQESFAVDRTRPGTDCRPPNAGVGREESAISQGPATFREKESENRGYLYITSVARFHAAWPGSDDQDVRVFYSDSDGCVAVIMVLFW